MAERRNPVNIGVIVGDEVLYTSDMEIRPVLDLSRFSISFASNLVNDARLAGFVHEPQVPNDGVEDGIAREHVAFTFLPGKGGEQVVLCCTYPSLDDLKTLGVANLSFDQLNAQARAFLDAFTRRFSTMISFVDVPFKQLPQDKLLKFHQVMYDLYRETIQASGIIFADQHPVGQRPPSGVLQDGEKASFLFAAVMHGSMPCATRFFETMEGFFRITVDGTSSDVQSIVENLISAQLSTIVTTARSIAKTMIREVELRLLAANENLYITFYPIKDEYSLVLISKGSPNTLRFFTQATAAVLAGLDVLEEAFTGDTSCFTPVKKVLDEIPPSFEQGKTSFGLDGVVEDIDFEIVTASDGKKQKRQRPTRENLDQDEEPFERVKASLEKFMRELNEAVEQGKLKKAAKLARSLVDQARKSGNMLLTEYLERKVQAFAGDE